MFPSQVRCPYGTRPPPTKKNVDFEEIRTIFVFFGDNWSVGTDWPRDSPLPIDFLGIFEERAFPIKKNGTPLKKKEQTVQSFNPIRIRQ